MALRLQRNRSAPTLADTANSPRQAAAAGSGGAGLGAAAFGGGGGGLGGSGGPGGGSGGLEKFFPKSGRSGVFLVEDVERPQADVGDFFLTESDLGRGGIPRRYIRGRNSGCRGCAARQRQGHTDDSHHRYDFLRMFSLRSTLRVRHSRVLPRLLANVQRPEHYWYALATDLARPITHADRRSLREADAHCRTQREHPFIRHSIHKTLDSIHKTLDSIHKTLESRPACFTKRAGGQRVPRFYVMTTSLPPL